MTSQARIDYLIGKLPRKYLGELNARAWVDSAGRLCVDLKDGGALILNQDDHDLLEGGEDD